VTHLPDIWNRLISKLPWKQWVNWKRNVRDVLQYRKGTGDVEWYGAGKYRF
jgi:hypothetical protein